MGIHLFGKRRSCIPVSSQIYFTVVILGVISSTVYLLLLFIYPKVPGSYSQTMLKAAQTMEKAIFTLQSYCDTAGISIDVTIDPNRTGLIGPETSELLTTPGDLAAKRTTTNPDMAALIVQLLNQAGVHSGDTIAVGCSASFPALLIAALAASQALNVHPIVIISLGASSYGGTNPDFTLLNIYTVLLREKIFTVPPAAVSLGGENDTGQDFTEAVKKRLLRKITESGLPFINELNLEKNVASRMNLYFGSNHKRTISAFINIGGSTANIGTSPLALKLTPGLNTNISIPQKDKRGVLFEMAKLHIPVIHLLYVKGLTVKYGLPWDPIPLPNPGKSPLFSLKPQTKRVFWFITSFYFISLGISIIAVRFKISPTKFSNIDRVSSI